MSNCPSVNLYHVECAVDNLNALVFEVMGPLGFNEDPRSWRRQLEEYFAAWYSEGANDGKETIRAVAQKFAGTGRTRDILQRGADLIGRSNVRNNMLAALEIFSSPQLILLQLENPALARLKEHFSIFCDTMEVIFDKVSHWQRECRAWEGVFVALQSAEMTETLLSSMPATVPEDYLIKGRDLIDQMVECWTVRRDVVEAANVQFHRFQLEDPKPLMERLDIQRETLPQVVSSFMVLVKELHDLPPLRVSGQEYSARQLFEADKAFTRLSSQLVLIEQDIRRLERIFDRFLTMFNEARLAMEG